MDFIYNDGGRSASGYQGKTGDCVCRSIAIATGRPYQEVYNALNALGSTERTGKRKRGKSNARTGVYKRTFRQYLEGIGWKFVPTMHIGSGCKVHLHDGELPMGRLIVSLSRHLTAVINGVIHDTFDPQREIWVNVAGPHHPDGDREPIAATGETKNVNGVWRPSRRCVYGYYIAA